MKVLAVNGGSSSIRYAVFDAGPPMARVHHGKIDEDPRGLTRAFVSWIQTQGWFGALDAVGHRIVHGMQHTRPQRITSSLLADLQRLLPYDPEHLPRELELILALQHLQPALPQVACFDTAFHAGMPRTAQLLPIPRRYFRQGVRRYGFHGLSYTYLSRELHRIGEPAVQNGRMVYAHLGSGASVAAILNGRSVDTSMAFTSTAGLLMSSRSGDLDPGLVSYLARTEQMSADRFQRMVTHESGLLGVSETSADMRVLLANESTDERAADAVEMFCVGARKWIAAMAASLGGMDVLVFTGGIGENAAPVRERICEGLSFLGVCLDSGRNLRNEAIISTDPADVRVRVVPTDEESVLADDVIHELRDE